MPEIVPDIFRAAANNNVRVLEDALEAGTAVNSQDANGLTALHHAAASLATEAVDFLLSRNGVDATLVDHFGRTAADVPFEVWGTSGDEMTKRLLPFCYPCLFEDEPQQVIK